MQSAAPPQTKNIAVEAVENTKKSCQSSTLLRKTFAGAVECAVESDAEFMNIQFRRGFWA